VLAPLLDRPRLGFYNVHPSPLPRYRGPDPLFWQIRARETRTAVAVHHMVERFDAGPVALAVEMPIFEHDTWGALFARAAMGARHAVTHLIAHLAAGGDVAPVAQDEAAATTQPRPGGTALVIDWAHAPAAEVAALVRAANPALGGAVTTLRGAELRVLQVSVAGPATAAAGAAPGTILAAGAAEGLVVACADGVPLRIDVVYVEEGCYTGALAAALFGLRAGQLVGAG
jgi:methionyl-tRNA formyltransferase